MTNRVQISLEVPTGIMSKSSGEKFLGLILRQAASISPNRYGNYEPLRNILDPQKPEQALEAWKEDFSFYWDRKSTKTEGSVTDSAVYRPSGNIFGGAINITTLLDVTNFLEISEFVKEVSVEFKAHFGYIHVLSNEEIGRGLAPRSSFFDPGKKEYHLIVALQDLVRYLPDLYWATIFGRIYVDHFGREKLLSAPAPIVRELDGGQVYIQLSDNPWDMETDFERVDAIRQAVKRHLNNDSFWDPTLPDDYSYKVPDFNRTVF